MLPYSTEESLLDPLFSYGLSSFIAILYLAHFLLFQARK